MEPQSGGRRHAAQPASSYAPDGTAAVGVRRQMTSHAGAERDADVCRDRPPDPQCSRSIGGRGGPPSHIAAPEVCKGERAITASQHRWSKLESPCMITYKPLKNNYVSSMEYMEYINI